MRVDVRHVAHDHRRGQPVGAAVSAPRTAAYSAGTGRTRTSRSPASRRARRRRAARRAGTAREYRPRAQPRPARPRGLAAGGAQDGVRPVARRVGDLGLGPLVAGRRPGSRRRSAAAPMLVRPGQADRWSRSRRTGAARWAAGRPGRGGAARRCPRLERGEAPALVDAGLRAAGGSARSPSVITPKAPSEPSTSWRRSGPAADAVRGPARGCRAGWRGSGRRPSRRSARSRPTPAREERAAANPPMLAHS